MIFLFTNLEKPSCITKIELILILSGILHLEGHCVDFELLECQPFVPPIQVLAEVLRDPEREVVLSMKPSLLFVLPEVSLLQHFLAAFEEEVYACFRYMWLWI